MGAIISAVKVSLAAIECVVLESRAIIEELGGIKDDSTRVRSDS